MSEFLEPVSPPGDESEPTCQAENRTAAEDLCDEKIMGIADATSDRALPPSGDRGSTSNRAPTSRMPSYQTLHLATSTLLSLLMVLALLLIARLVVPSLVESIRYGWYRGQLRAEYELSGERLKSVSLDSLADVSQLVSRRVGPSVVHINLLRSEKQLELPVSDDRSFEEFARIPFNRNDPQFRYEGQGSGFVIDTAGHILTNNHVVSGSGKIEVTLSDGRQLPAIVIGEDRLTDLAVLKVDAHDLLPVDWGDSDAVSVGTPVWATGSPFGLQQTVTFGIISGKHRIDFRGTRYEQSVFGGNAYGDLMQSDVALNPGNSGGPLVNSMGEVIGVNAAILGETYRGVSFSIPSNVARRVAGHLIIEGQVPRGWLGVVLLDVPLDDRFDQEGRAIPGVLVDGFPLPRVRSPAREAGFKIGDLIVSFDGRDVVNQVELQKMIGETDVGQSVKFGVLRTDERLEFDVAIGRRP